MLSLSHLKSLLDSEVLPAGSHKIKSQQIKTERLKVKNQRNSIKKKAPGTPQHTGVYNKDTKTERKTETKIIMIIITIMIITIITI